MNTKPFDLDLAKQGKKVITKGGLPVRIICFDRQHPVYPIVALLPYPDGDEFAQYYPLNGRDLDNDDYTLVHPYEQKEQFLLCPFNNGVPKTELGSIYDTYDEAAHAARQKKGCIWVIVKQTWEE